LYLEGNLTSLDSAPIKEERHYTYLYAYDPFQLRSKHKNPSPPMPCNLCMFRFMISFTLYFTMGKAHRCVTFPKCQIHYFIFLANFHYSDIKNPSTNYMKAFLWKKEGKNHHILRTRKSDVAIFRQ